MDDEKLFLEPKELEKLIRDIDQILKEHNLEICGYENIDPCLCLMIWRKER